MTRISRRRRNPGIGTGVLLGAAAIAAVVLGPKLFAGAPPPAAVATGSQPAIPVPLDIQAQMVYVWQANGKPTNKDTWIQVMKTVLPLTTAQWGGVFDRGIGFNKTGGTWADAPTVYNWVVQAASS